MGVNKLLRPNHPKIANFSWLIWGDFDLAAVLPPFVCHVVIMYQIVLSGFDVDHTGTACINLFTGCSGYDCGICIRLVRNETIKILLLLIA